MDSEPERTEEKKNSFLFLSLCFSFVEKKKKKKKKKFIISFFLIERREGLGTSSFVFEKLHSEKNNIKKKKKIVNGMKKNRRKDLGAMF